MGKVEGAKPLQNLYFPLSFEGEGDKGGEVGKQPQGGGNYPCRFGFMRIGL